MTAPCQTFKYVPELDDTFLALFPHRGDYLWAEHPDPGDRPEWQTESRHLLSDRLMRQGAYLYGVRFGKTTQYLLLDIDAGSPYHPGNNPQALSDICAALEPLGLVQPIAIQSSDRAPAPQSQRRGIHLYFPFEKAQNSYQLAFAAKACLERRGFKHRDGWLEILPNPRPYQDGKPALYRGHRLPLQPGSYLLNQDFEPIATTEAAFVAQWHHAQRRNDVDRATVEQVSREIIRKTEFPSASAAKFNADLDAEINLGFTGSGQTNHLLGRVVMKGYIFHHVLNGSDPLEGEALVAYAVETIQALPDYEAFCGHKHEIEQKARDYTRAIEASRYYHYDPSKSKRPKAPSETLATDAQPHLPSLNEQRSSAAKQRILDAIADLLNQGLLSAQPTARKRAIVAYGVSPRTLDKYRDLWHPTHLQPVAESDHTPPNEVMLPEVPQLAQEGEEHTITSNKLVSSSAAPLGQAERHERVGGCGGNVEKLEDSDLNPVSTESQRQIRHIRQQQDALCQARDKERREHYRQKLQAWANSDDPILKNEARFCLQPEPPELSISETPVSERLPLATPNEDVTSAGVGEPPDLLQSKLSETCLEVVYSELPEAIADESTDLSELLAEISVHIERLGLTREAVKAYCLTQFRRPRCTLSEPELMLWLNALRRQT